MIRRLLGPVLLLAVLLLSPLPALASSSGSVGVHALIDTDKYPGVTCTFHNFDPRDDLKRITVRPPIVYAVDRSSAMDSQWVSWRFRVQVTDVPNPAPGDWYDLYTAPKVKVMATDAYNAQWTSRSFAVVDGTAHADWRAVVDMYWFFPNKATQSGKATQFPAFYQVRAGSDRHPTGRQGCGETLG